MRILLLFLVFLSIDKILLGLSVLSVSPGQNSLDVPVDAVIEISFDEPVDVQSVNGMTVSVFGRWSGVAEWAYQLSNGNTLLTLSTNENFFYGEYIMIGLSEGIGSTSGDALEGGFAFGFWTEVMPGSMVLEDIGHLQVREEGEGLIQCYGAYAGDLNEDGWSDLSVVNETAGDIRVFLSDEGTYSDFAVHPLPLGNKPSANEGADFNGDGNIDLVLGNTQGDMVSVVLGDGEGHFSDEVIYEAGQGVRGVTVIDLEGDGDMDVVSANRQGNDITFFLNDGAGNFSAGIDMPTPLNGETAILSADMNEDGKMDLVVGAYLSDEIAVLLNVGSGLFELHSQIPTGDGPWMLAMGDINGDGHIDISAACSASHAISVHMGDGTGSLSSAELLPSGSFPLAIDLGDLDGDGDLDLICSNYNGGSFSLYENLGSGEFGNLQTLDAEIAGSCAIFHDRDHDGRMDITGIDELADVLIFFQNSPLSIEDRDAIGFSIFPNPNPGEFTVRNHSGVPLNLELIDLEGRLVQENPIPSSLDPFLWKVEGASPGIYFLKAQDSHTSFKLVIE